MCKEKKEIKFCTCLGEEDADWKLTRNAKIYSYLPHVMGRCVRSQQDIIEDIIREEILQSLNNNTLFDIEDYTPCLGDTLEVYDLGIYEYKTEWVMISKYHPFDKQVSISEKSDSKIFSGKCEIQG